ncbi:MAG: L-glutamate gamma-semialdehyde dehydrogenase [Bacteroidia bacterium]|nr:L-glutamate gamma-semialdehyde dehydrogenase [Bacteroidia bacterium]
MKGFFSLPAVQNEPVLPYAPGDPARKALEAELHRLRATTVDIPMYIGAERVYTQDKRPINPPHDHRHLLGHYSRGTKVHFEQAVAAALAAKPAWEALSWEHRASIFLKAADLMATKYRPLMNASTMLAQAKTAHQSEIDAVCELVDFLRYNVQYMAEIYRNQPASAPGMWNRLEYRPLEGFVFALTPFNFTSIAGNLPMSPALMGNTVVWKPAESQVYSAQVILDIYLEAGLPAGVINLVYGSGAEMGEVFFGHPEFAGLHFTGSTGVFQNLWKTIGENLPRYRSYPRIVGETGGKDFIVAHPSAQVDALAVAMVRGAFEFQGQKCSAASRVYLPKSLADAVLARVVADLKTIKMGPVEDFSNFVSAVIDKKAFEKITAYIDQAKQDPSVTVVAGGNYDGSTGYYIEPTVLLTTNPASVTMCEEIFGPVLTVFVYDDAEWEATLRLVDQTSPYALTGALFAQDRYAIEAASHALRNCAGNFYINDKPTGAVVNQQPFGGARGSGTNDKAGSLWNLIRWTSPRAIKETFVPPVDYRYPFLG